MAGPIRISVIANVRNAIKNLGDVDNRIARMVRNIDGNTRKLNKSVGYFGVLGRAAFLAGGKFALMGGAVLAAIPIVAKLTAALIPTVGILAAMPGVVGGMIAAVGVFKLATNGMSDAISTGWTGTMEEFQKSMKDFGPQMKRFATNIVGLKNPFLELRKSTGEALFGQVNDQIIPLADRYLPTLRRLLPPIAKAIGNVGKQFLIAARSTVVFNGIKSVLKGTASGINNASKAVQPLVKAFGALLPIGASLLPRMGTAVADLATKFADWLTAAAKSGKAMQWVTGALKAFGQLGRIVLNVGKLFLGLYKSANGGGDTFLGKIETLTKRWSDFMNSVKGQDALKSIWTLFSNIASGPGLALVTVISQLIPSFALLANTILTKLIPVVTAIVGWIQKHEDSAKSLAVVIGSSVVAFKILSTAINIYKTVMVFLGPVVNLLSKAIRSQTAMKLKDAVATKAAAVAQRLWQATMNVGQLAAYGIKLVALKVATLAQSAASAVAAGAQRLWTAALALGPIIAYGVQLVALKGIQIAMAAGSKIAAAAQWLFNAAMTANPVGLVIAAIALLVAGIVWLATKTKFFQTIWKGLTAGFTWLWNWVKGNWPKLLMILTGPIGLAVGYMIKHWSNIKTAFTNGINAIKNAFNGVKTWMSNIGKDIMNGLKAGIEGGFQWIKDKVGALGSLMPDWLKEVLGIASPSKVFAKIGLQSVEGVRDGFQSLSAKDIVGSLAKNLTKTKLPTLNAPALATPSYATTSTGSVTSGGNVYNIYVTVPLASDKARVGDDIIEAVRASEAKRGQQFLVTRGASV